MKRKVKLLGGCVGGCAVAAIAAVGFGGMAGASTVAIPIPGVGQVGVISENGSSGSEDCLAAQLDSDPSQPLGVCYINASNPFGQNITAIAVQEGGTTTYISLNPFGISSS